MALEKSQIKFAKSDETGELIGFVSRHSKTRKLKGVRETSHYGKKICVLSEEIKGTILPNVLYNVELKDMRNNNGYVVVSAEPVQFAAKIETIIIPKTIYQVTITFGNKTIYYDPKDGKSPSSRTVEGVVKILSGRLDIADCQSIISVFKNQATQLNISMERDGIFLSR